MFWSWLEHYVGFVLDEIRCTLSFFFLIFYRYFYHHRKFSMTDKYKQLWKKVSKMDLGNPVSDRSCRTGHFLYRTKTFFGGMKSMGNMEHLHWFTVTLSTCLSVALMMTLPAIIITIYYCNHRTCCVWCYLSTAAIACAWSKHRNNWNDMVSRFASLRWYAER